MHTVSVPKLRVRGSPAAGVRPSRLEAWLAALPQANAEDSMGQIKQALFVQNRTALESGNRLNLMELYLEPVLNIIESITQSYVTSSFPLTLRQFELATSVQHLCEELANGYKVVANDLIQKKAIVKNRADFALALQRATDTLSRIVLNSCTIYRAYPEGLWHQLHQLYKIAEEQEILNYPVTETRKGDSTDGTMTVMDSYQRAILLGGCNPYGLLQGECANLFNLIPKWQAGVRIMTWAKGKKKDRPGSLLINLSSDSPPIPLLKIGQDEAELDRNPSLRVIGTLDVVREVHAILKELETNSPKSGAGVFPVGRGTNYELLRRFGRVLAGVNIVRRSTRSGYDREIPVCVGMNSTHFFANGQRTFQAPDAEKQKAVSTTSDDSEEYFDITDPAIGNCKEADQSLSGPIDLALYSNIHRLFTCSVKDQSASGLCVEIENQPEFRVRVGDLIGLQFPTPNQWRVGVIRWLKNRAGESFEFGAQLLAPSLHPVAVKRNLEDDAFFQALLLPSNQALKQPESLLVPRGAYEPGNKLILSRENSEQLLISPLQILDRTGSYDQLLVVLPEDSAAAVSSSHNSNLENTSPEASVQEE